MSSTRKLLVEFDPKRPIRAGDDVVVPWREGNGRVLRGLKSGRRSAFGRVVLTSQEITEKDLFAKVVDSGEKLENVADVHSLLQSYVEEVARLRIGNVVRLKSSDAASKAGLFELEWAVPPSAGRALKLP